VVSTEAIDWKNRHCGRYELRRNSFAVDLEMIKEESCWKSLTCSQIQRGTSRKRDGGNIV